MLSRFFDRPLSHSQLSSFEYDKEQWYLSYIKGIRFPASPEMIAGSRVGDSIGTDKSELPDLNPPGQKEYEMKAVIDGITIIGYADHYCRESKTLHENKTSTNKYRWNQRKTDEHGQLTMYALLLQLQDGTNPEEVNMQLNFIPLKLTGVELRPTGTIKLFTTSRTQEQVDAYVEYIKATIKDMESYAQQRIEAEKRCVSMVGTARLL